MYAAPSSSPVRRQPSAAARYDTVVRHPHFTQTSSSWLNLVEGFIAVIIRQAIRRGPCTPVRDINASARAIDSWNDHPRTIA
jgi:hypothetical protein